MSWGKIIGGAIGAAMGGPLGAGIGVAIGAGFDEEEKERPRIETAPPEPAFHIFQVGNILRLRSRVRLPREATRIVALVGHDGDTLKSLIEPFADDEGDFAMRKRIVDGAVAFEIPLHVLPIKREVETSIDVLVVLLNGDEPIRAIEVPVSVQIARERWSAIRWLHPEVDLYTSYLLRSGPWDSSKVKLFKTIYGEYIDGDAHEADALRQRLKLVSRPDFDACIDALRVRFDEDELARIVFPGLAGILKACGWSNLQVVSEVEDLVGIFRLSPAIITAAKQRLQGYIDPNAFGDFDEPDDAEEDDAESSQMQRAREVLGVQAGASREAVQAAWRKKISDLHPDRYANLPEVVQTVLKETAQEINRARDILLG